MNGDYNEHFPVDIFQTGSGTSTNMNVNEVISRLSNNNLNENKVHPNDHVNMGQSSNDTIPTAINISASLMIQNQLDQGFFVVVEGFWPKCLHHFF